MSSVKSSDRTMPRIVQNRAFLSSEAVAFVAISINLKRMLCHESSEHPVELLASCVIASPARKITTIKDL